MTTLLLLRHSIPERGGSSPDPGLSAEGLQRAAAVFQNDAFRTVSLVWSSPSLRALQTAQLLGLPVRQDTRRAPHRRHDRAGRFVLETPIRRPGLQKSGRRVLP